MDYSHLIDKLGAELKTKSKPGPVLDSLMFARLELFSKKYEHNHELLLLGAILADIRLDEAVEIGNIAAHVELALDYAKELFSQNDIVEADQEIITEIIATHHGGEQKHIESKIFKNADNFKFLETKGCMHYFGSFYEEQTIAGIANAAKETMIKLDEKLALTDLDDETKAEAKKLYDFNSSFLKACL